jgi:sulfotransferase 6B1
MPDLRSSRLQKAVWGPTSTKVRQNTWLRGPAATGYRLFARMMPPGAPPKILANSIPKSGTHLLTKVLSGVPHLRFTGVHLADRAYCADRDQLGDALGPVDVEAFTRLISHTRNGQYLTAHIRHVPGIPEALRDHGFHNLFMIRDPRDLVVSMAYWLSTNPRLKAYERFSKMSGPEERIMAAITGLPAQNGKPAVMSISHRLAFRGWLDDPQTCVIRFEDLIGSAGGGTDEAQREAIRRVLKHCNRDTSDELVDRLAMSTFARHTTTFRRGAIGDWQNHLTPEHLAAIDDVAPEILDIYGYA